MTFNPKVSIVIPVYNGKNYLSEAIDSALGQTYKNLEVIVINDGSTDNGATEIIAKSYGDKIRYFSKPNGGVSSALNLGIEKMTGEYFSWLSHDDMYYPDKIQFQIDSLSKEDNKEVVFFGDYDLINESSIQFASIKVKSFPKKRIKYELIKSSPIHGCTLLIAKSLFTKTGLFDEKLRTSQDYDLWFKMADFADFIHLDKPFVKSRIHGQQGTQSMSEVMRKESEQLYLREVPKILTRDSGYSAGEVIACARGLVREYCFESAALAISLIPASKITTSSIKKLFFYFFDLLFYKAVYYRRKMVKKRSFKKSILIVTPGFFPLPGGLSEHSYLIGKEFVKRGYKVDVLTERLKRELAKTEVIDGMCVTRVSYIKKRNILGLLRIICETVFFLIRNRKKYAFCIIRTISLYAILIGFLKRVKILPYRTYCSAESGGENDEISEIALRPWHKALFMFLRGNSYINSNNHDNTRHYIENGVPKQKITIVYNGIDMSDYASSKYPKKIDTFIFMSELNAAKGIAELLDAFRAVLKVYPDKKLYIGGYGKMEEHIKSYIIENRLQDNLFFDGYISKDAKKAFFEKGDCFVFPSYSEGFGIVTAEAIKFKRQLITTKVADLEKLYGNDVLYCEIKSAENLASVMIKAIEEYDQSKMNYDDIVAKIDIKTNAENIERLFI